MKFINSLILLFVISILNDFALTQRQISPCPSVFTYDTDRETSDTWYGTLKLETSVPLHGITVDVILDSRASTFGAYYFNDVTTHDYKEYRVENKNFKLDPGRTLVMNVYVRYDETTPLLKQVRLNGQNICVDLPSVAPVQPIYPSNINSQQTTTTRSVTRREQHPGRQYSFDFNYAQNNEPASRPTQTTSNSNDFRQSNGSNVYNENNYSQFSGHETERPYSNINPSRDVTNNNRDVYNQPREILPNSVGFVSDSLSGTSNSGNERNVNSASITQRPYSQQTTTTLNYDNNRRATQSTTYYDSNSNNNRRTMTTTANYDYNVFPRTTAPTYRPNRDVTTRRSTYFQGDLPFLNKNNNNNDDNDETSTHSILNVDSDSQCGSVIPKVNPLIVHGEETYQGQFPWHAALYLSDIGSLRYICGGSLVSMNAVVTAAHCVTHEKTKRSINSDKVLVYLGKTSLQKWTGPEQDAKVAEIVVNHEYDPERFYSDIAILKLKDSLAKTNFVRPVCLWNLETDLKLIVNKLGAVPGWGYNENGLVSEDLSYVKMPVVTHETCIWSNRDFFSKVTSEKSFCAGFRNGSTICNGDSGGGMVFKQGKQYFLRGVVSISIALQNSLKCDPNHFAVFVDAAKYTTWIKQNI